MSQDNEWKECVQYRVAFCKMIETLNHEIYTADDNNFELGSDYSFWDGMPEMDSLYQKMCALIWLDLRYPIDWFHCSHIYENCISQIMESSMHLTAEDSVIAVSSLYEDAGIRHEYVGTDGVFKLFNECRDMMLDDCDFEMYVHWSYYRCEIKNVTRAEFDLKRDHLNNVFSRYDSELKEINAPYFMALSVDDLKLANPKKKKKSPKGFVYLMQSGVHNLTKIGFSKKPKVREKTLQGEDPLLHMIFSMKGSMTDERNFHSDYKDKRVRGEWFNLTRQDIEFIKEHDQC